MASPRLLIERDQKLLIPLYLVRMAFHYDNLTEPTKTERFHCPSSQFINFHKATFARLTIP